jgi:bifunctional DNA-binding transcriptional regulator/antitoxin component of YhaV-PrlF toxin-antitoxin module
MSKPEIFGIVKVISGGRVTIPEEIRRAAKIRDGDHLAVYFEKKSGAPTVRYVPVDITPKKLE